MSSKLKSEVRYTKVDQLVPFLDQIDWFLNSQQTGTKWLEKNDVANNEFQRMISREQKIRPVAITVRVLLLLD